MQASTSNAGGKYAEPILLRLDRGVDAFGFDHISFVKFINDYAVIAAVKKFSCWIIFYKQMAEGMHAPDS